MKWHTQSIMRICVRGYSGSWRRYALKPDVDEDEGDVHVDGEVW